MSSDGKGGPKDPFGKDQDIGAKIHLEGVRLCVPVSESYDEVLKNSGCACGLTKRGARLLTVIPQYSVSVWQCHECKLLLTLLTVPGSPIIENMTKFLARTGHDATIFSDQEGPGIRPDEACCPDQLVNAKVRGKA